jgi:hypothetical protein
MRRKQTKRQVETLRIEKSKIDQLEEAMNKLKNKLLV